MSWLLLLHQIPPKPPYFRAKILRRLAQVGALPVKNSAYLLPETEDTREDFEWIVREISNEGGTAWMFRVESLSMSGDQIADGFRQLRTPDYEDLIVTANELLDHAATPADITKLLHRFVELKKIDFFDHPLRAKAIALIEQLQSAPAGGTGTAPASAGRVWVTRKGIKVDRIASAWLIRRFIDPQATFRYVDAATYRHAEPELRFDMYEGEFTHEGDLCTFEVLVKSHQLAAQHPALLPIAEMVHDIDLKDRRYERPETNGVSRTIDGMCARIPDDDTRLEQGSQIFESLFQSF
jgi:hypothetical protein